MRKKIISTANAPAAIGTYSQAVQVGNTVWVSGQIALDPKTKELVGGGIEAEVHQVFKNVEGDRHSGRRRNRRRGQGHGISHRSVALRAGQQDHGGVFPRALPGARGCRRLRAAARRADRSGVHRRAVTIGASARP